MSFFYREILDNLTEKDFSIGEDQKKLKDIIEKVSKEQKQKYNLPSPEDTMLTDLNRLSEHDIERIQSM